MVDIVFDNQPENIEITEVFQKWAGLQIRFKGEDELFKELTQQVYYISQKMCELCGKSGYHTVIDGWETTLCDTHFMQSDSKAKYRGNGKGG